MVNSWTGLSPLRAVSLIRNSTIWKMNSGLCGPRRSKPLWMDGWVILSESMLTFPTVILRVSWETLISTGTVTSKTRVTAGWSHDLFNSQTAANFLFTQVGYAFFPVATAINDRFYIMPVWQITAKTALRVRYDYMMQHFKGAVAPVPADRSDSQHSAMIALDWQPYNYPLAERRVASESSQFQSAGFRL